MPYFPRHYYKEEHIIKSNKMLETHAVSGHYTFVNIFKLFLNHEQMLDAKYS